MTDDCTTIFKLSTLHIYILLWPPALCSRPLLFYKAPSITAVTHFIIYIINWTLPLKFLAFFFLMAVFKLLIQLATESIKLYKNFVEITPEQLHCWEYILFQWQNIAKKQRGIWCPTRFIWWCWGFRTDETLNININEIVHMDDHGLCSYHRLMLQWKCQWWNKETAI